MSFRATPAQAPVSTTSEARAIAYLSGEVPAWRREHPCYSCHNNGDAARALVAALGQAPEVRAALDDTLKWLAEPSRWETNGGGEGGADDKRLARIQFAHAATTAFAAALVSKAAIDSAAAIVAADQQDDGSWRLDSSDSIGSPATYGTALATVFARRTLVASGLSALGERIARADRWLSRLEVHNVPDATAIMFAFADPPGGPVPDNWRAAVDAAAERPGTRRRLGTLRHVARRTIRHGAGHARPARADETAFARRALIHEGDARRARSRRAELIWFGSSLPMGAGTRRRDPPGRRVTRSESPRRAGRSWRSSRREARSESQRPTVNARVRRSGSGVRSVRSKLSTSNARPIRLPARSSRNASATRS